MAFSITLSTAAAKSAYQRFGDAFITALTQAMPGLDMAQCQSILSDVVGTVGRKAPKEKKAPKSNKSPKVASPSKRDLKKVELIGELKSYGAFAGEIPDVASATITAAAVQQHLQQGYPSPVAHTLFTTVYGPNEIAPLLLPRKTS